MSTRDHSFGGDWTERKLQHVSAYLDAYLKVMQKQHWCQRVYIDCFAGTGYRNREEDQAESSQLLWEDEAEEGDLSPDEAQQVSEAYRDGSARIALKKSPGFHRHVFVEKYKKKCESLQQLAKDFPGKTIEIHQGDVNAFLQGQVRSWNWREQRACVFIDPYGMQLEWESLVALAETKAADVWILMPVGVGVNRLLTRSGKIEPSWESRLTKFFGCPPEEWRPKLYRDTGQQGLFGDPAAPRKVAKLEEIARYLIERLGEIFEGVAQNPKALGPAGGAPLFYLFFAAANPKGAPIAIEIAENILGKN